MDRLDQIVNLDMEEPELSEVFDYVLCGIFTEETDMADKALAFVLKSIRMSEVKGPTKVLFYMLTSLNKLGIRNLSLRTLNVETIGCILENGLSKFIRKYSYDFNDWINKHGLDYSLDSLKGFSEFESFLFAQTIQKFNEITSLESNLVLYMETLSNRMQEIASEQAIVYISSVLTKGEEIRFPKKEFLQGTNSCLDLMQRIPGYIRQRFCLDNSEEARYEMTSLDSFETATEMIENEKVRRASKGFYETLYDTGFGTLDLQIMREDIFAIIGDEGVGKTKLLVDQVYRALCAGNNVLLVCTETKKINMLYMLYARHINEMTGLEPSHVELLKFQSWIDSTTDLEIKRRMEEDYTECMSAIPSFYGKGMGTLTLVQSAKYDDFRDCAMRFSEKDGDIIAIDSISFLDKPSGRYAPNEKESIDSLMKDMEYLTTETGMTFIFTTHTSSEANKTLSKGKSNTGVRVGAGSGHVTKIATITILVSTTEELSPQEKFVFEAKKTRDRRSSVNSVIMLRNGNSNKYEFRKELQVTTEIEDGLSDEDLY